MPELPDIEIFSRNLKKIYAGKTVERIKVVNGRKLKDKPAQLSGAIEGKKLLDVYRSGKEMRLQFKGNIILGLHLMLTGDLLQFGKKNDKKNITIVEFYFRSAPALALTDRMKNAYVKLEPQDKKGLDALDKKLNFKTLKQILQRKTNIKNVLLDQDSIRGIGNAYSDEILWQTRISPFSVANAIPDEKIRELAKKIKQVLKKATKEIAKNYPDLLHGEVKEFLDIHTKKKTHSPTGAPIIMTDKGMMKTFYTEEQVEYK